MSPNPDTVRREMERRATDPPLPEWLALRVFQRRLRIRSVLMLAKTYGGTVREMRAAQLRDGDGLAALPKAVATKIKRDPVWSLKPPDIVWSSALWAWTERQRRGLTMAYVAGQLGISKVTLTLFEKEDARALGLIQWYCDGGQRWRVTFGDQVVIELPATNRGAARARALRVRRRLRKRIPIITMEKVA